MDGKLTGAAGVPAEAPANSGPAGAGPTDSDDVRLAPTFVGIVVVQVLVVVALYWAGKVFGS
jgi:hypothetical protein